MGKPSEARHSGECLSFGRGRLDWDVVAGHVVSRLFHGKGAGWGEGKERKPSPGTPKLLLRRGEEAGKPFFLFEGLPLKLWSWTLVLLKPCPPAAQSTLLVNCDKGGCVLFCFERSRFPWVLVSHGGCTKCMGMGRWVGTLRFSTLSPA